MTFLNKKNIIKFCKSKKKPITNTRLLIYNIFLKYEYPLSAYEIKKKLDNLGKKINISTVYRVLDFWINLKILHKLPSINKFLLCTNPEEKHIHMLNVCTKCEKVFETCNVSMGIKFNKRNFIKNMTVNPELAIEIPVICTDCK